MRKIHLFILIFVIMFSNVSCSKDTKVIPDKGTVTLNFSTFYDDNVQADAYREIVKAFEQSHNNIKINISAGSVNYDEKIKSAIEAGKAPDIMGLQRSVMLKYIKQGNLKDLSQWIESEKHKDNYFGVSLGYGKYDGKYYGIGDMPYIADWYYNVDLFKKAGVKEPKTLSELIDVCSKLKKYVNAPIMLGAKDPWAMNVIFGMISVQTANGNKLSKAYANGDKTELQNINGISDAANIVNQLVKAGSINKSVVDYDYASSVDAFVKGKAAILPMGSWAIDRIEKTKPKGFNYKSFDNPVLFVSNPDSKYSATGVQVITVNEKSNYPKETMEFMSFLFSKEAQKIFADKNGVSGFKSENTVPSSQIKRSTVEHLGLTDEGSYMFIDNVSNSMMETAGSKLQELIDGEVKPAEIWGLIVNESKQ